VYDHPFELYVGDYAFDYSYEQPNELLALFTEKDRRPPSKSEEGDLGASEIEEANPADPVPTQVEPHSLDVVNSDSGLSKLELADRIEPIPHDELDNADIDVFDPEIVNPSGMREAEELLPEDADTEEPYSEKAYDVPVSVMRERLEIMGFSDALWREELQEYVNRKIAYKVKDVEEQEVGTPERKRAERRLAVVQRSSPQRWMKKWLQSVDRNLNQDYSLTEDMLMYEMYDKHTGQESIFTRQLIALRGALEALSADDFVSFVFTNAVYQEEIVAADAALSETARYTVLRAVREFDPILVLTEGRTDARIIAESFDRIHPEIAHMFSYMDHATFKVPGGTSALVGLARSLAGAKISNRIIFLFDNDTAGHEGYQQFKKVKCPTHYQGLILPYLRSAEAYPTIGPTGDAPANVNTCACGIELYCGPKALTGDDGSPCPVQWKGYMDGMKRYQGEPIDKDGIKERFLLSLRRTAHPKTDPELEDMRLVLKALTEVRWH
jgi:HEPN/Toprim N-terminal domain 1